MEILPLTTGLIALLTTMLTGVLRSLVDKTKSWHPLATQALVLGISLAVTAGAHWIGLIPAGYRDLATLLLQALVGALGAVGMNNVKDAAKYGSAGAISEERKLANTDVYVAKPNPGAEE